MIDVRGLTKRFGDVLAVSSLSLRAEDGRVTALLGPNGAGKTTTLRAISGLLQPDSGQILIDGQDVLRESAAAASRIGVLPEARGLYPRLTPREHVRYFGRLRGLAKAEIDRNCEALIDELGMSGIADRRAAGFSHGERTKVAIARALVHRPQNVLLDEPTAGLDVASTRAIREMVRRLRGEGRCVLFSSHIMQEVAAVCDWIVIVSSGAVIAEGTGDDLCAATGQDTLEGAFVELTRSEEAPA